MLKNATHISHCVTITQTNQFMLYVEICAAYCDQLSVTYKYTVWIQCRVYNVEASGTYSNHCAWKCYRFVIKTSFFTLSRIWLFISWRIPSSGIWRRVDPVKWTDVTEERIASIFRVEKSASEESAWAECCYLIMLVPRSRFFYPEDGGDTFLGSVGSFHRIYTAPQPRRRHSS
jgi:hypothetical protein